MFYFTRNHDIRVCYPLDSPRHLPITCATIRIPNSSSFRAVSFVEKFWRITPERGRQTRVGGENKLFSSFMRQYLENGTRYVQSYIMTNRKLHMRFRLALRSMTLDDLELL